MKRLLFAAAFVLALSTSAQGQSVVVNEFRNGGVSGVDVVELVVITTNLDMRGMILKDFSGSGVADTGGAYTFTTDGLWSSVRAGTIIVLTNDTTAVDVTAGGADYNLQVGLKNATYFTTGGIGTYDIATDDILMIKTAGSLTNGTSGSIHAFATDTAGGGTNYAAIATPKLRTLAGDSGTGESVAASNSTATIADFNGTGASGDLTTGTIGTWNNTNNETYILSLRVGGPTIDTNVQFDGSSASISEIGGAHTVTVVKTTDTGNMSGEIALAGSATNGADYTIAGTNFTLNGATTSATVVITMSDDALTEGNETAVLTFANVTGGGIGSPSTFTLTITDDDLPPTPTNVWINEVDYDSVGTDSNEWVEIVGADGVSLNDFELVMINEAGSPYSTFDLAPAAWTFTNEGNGYGYFVIGKVAPGEGAADYTPGTWTSDEIQQGPTDSIQLRLKIGPVNAHLVDYEGNNTFTTDDQNTTASDDNTTALKSIYLAGGPGSTFAAFSWTNIAGAATPGAVNSGEIVGAPPTNQPPVFQALGNKGATNGQALVLTVIARDIFDLDEITLSASNLPAGAVFNTITNFVGATNTFTWNPAGPVGVYTTTFHAVDNDGETVTACVITVVAAPPAVTNDPPVWINELHYSDGAGGVFEGAEIAGPAGTDLSLYALYYYDGGTGNAYSTNALVGTLDDEGCGLGSLYFATVGLQDGPDGVAVVFNGTGVVQFLSYEGVIAATSGPAAGIFSVDIGVSESGADPANLSLQLQGAGTNYNQFTWHPATNTQSRGSLNLGQSVSPCAPFPRPPVLQPVGNKIGTNNQALVFNVIAEDIFEGDAITLSASNLPPGAVFDPATNVFAVTNTFTWTLAGPPGVYTSTFYAVDNDGVTNASITIQIVDPVTLVVTTAPQTVAFAVTSIVVGGTASTNVVGQIRVLNPVNFNNVFFPAGANWAGSVPLVIGANNLVVSGSNLFGQVATGTVSITRLPPEITGCSSQVYFQGFEPGDTWAITNGTGFISTSNGAADFPPDQRIASGTNSWQARAQAATVELAQVTIAGYTGRYVRARVSATSTTGSQGLDAGDFVRISVSLDGGPHDLAVDVRGNNNALWGFWATNSFTGAAGESFVPTTGAPQAGQSSNNYSYVYVVIPDSANTLALRIAVDSDNAAEGWSVDDLALVGCPIGPQPPLFLPPIGSKITTNGAAFSFPVTAVDPVEGDTIELSASNLPPGAVFNTVTNAAAATNTFTWNPVGIGGIYTAAFYAVDNDGAVSSNVVITVREPPIITITTAPQTVNFFVTNITLGGTASYNVDGLFRWTNGGAGFNGTIPAATNWIINDIGLRAGNNFLAIRGSNAFGESTTASVIIVRDRLRAPTDCVSTVISQGFEAGDLWPIVDGSANISTNAGENDDPPGQRVLAGIASWQVAFQTATVDLANVSIAGFTNRYISLRLSVTDTNTAGGLGVTNTDFIRLTAALDGAAFSTNADLRLLGNSVGGGRWGYWATNDFSVFAGTTNTVTAPSGGLSSNQFTHLNVMLPDSATSVAFRVEANTVNDRVYWNVDEISVIGCPGSPCTDCDGDGLADAWELGFFGNLTNANAGSDSDADGFIDLHEFYAGSLPNDANSLLEETATAVVAAQGFRVTWQSHTGRFYIVARATNLLNDFTGIATNIAATPPVNVYTDTTAEAVQHYRIEGKNGPF